MIRTAVFALSFLMNLRFKQVNDVPMFLYLVRCFLRHASHMLTRMITRMLTQHELTLTQFEMF